MATTPTVLFYFNSETGFDYQSENIVRMVPRSEVLLDSSASEFADILKGEFPNLLIIEITAAMGLGSLYGEVIGLQPRVATCRLFDADITYLAWGSTLQNKGESVEISEINKGGTMFNSAD